MFLQAGDLLSACTRAAPAAEPTGLTATAPHLPAVRAAASQELFLKNKTSPAAVFTHLVS